MDTSTREMYVRNAHPDREVLTSAGSPSQGFDMYLTPDWNLADLTAAGSDCLAYLVTHRATNTLTAQYLFGWQFLTKSEEGANPWGDHEYVDTAMRSEELRHADPFANWYTFFNEEKYGKSVEVKGREEKIKFLKENGYLIKSKLCVPRAVGELVLARQTRLLLYLNTLVYELLNARNELSRTKAKFRLLPYSKQLLMLTTHHCNGVSDTLKAMHVDPDVLRYFLQYWYLSRPEQVADQNGRRQQIHEDKSISIAFLDAIHGAFRRRCIWRYIHYMLQVYQHPAMEDKWRAIVLREFAGVIYLEYRHAQTMLRRQLSAAKIATSSFERVASDGSIRLKGKPETLAADNEQLRYLFQLCGAKIPASKALHWLETLDELYDNSPSKKDELGPGVMHALADLTDIVHFIEMISEDLSMPTFNREKKDGFVVYATKLENEINRLRDSIDLSRFINSTIIDSADNSGAIFAAGNALSEFFVEKKGKEIVALYQDMQADSVKALCKRIGKGIQIPQPEAATIDQQSEAGDGSHITLPAQPEDECRSASNDWPAQLYHVDASTAEFFSTLLSQIGNEGEPMRPIPCVRLRVAFEELGFTVASAFGSVFAMYAPNLPSPTNKEVSDGEMILLHRRYDQRLYRSSYIILAHRLKEVYGWTKEMFQVVYD